MTTEWEFQIETHGVVLDGEDRNFIATAHAKTPEEMTVKVKVRRDAQAKGPDATDAGKVLIRIPGTPEQTEHLAHTVVLQITERLAFPHGRIDVLVLLCHFPGSPSDPRVI
jgi:hypothetical protein